MGRGAVRLLLVVLVLLMCRTAASAGDFEIGTRVGGVVVYDASDGHEVARDVAGTLRWDPASVRTYRIQCPPYDAIRLALAWDDAEGQWQWVVDGRRRGFGNIGVLDFTRTIHVEMDPPDASLLVAAEGLAEPADVPAGLALGVGGQVVPVRPVPAVDGGYRISSAWAPHAMYVARPGFQIQELALGPGALETTLHVRLRPLYGPFSYARFRLVSMGLLAAVLGWWGAVVRPRRERARRVQQRRMDLRSQVSEPPTSLEGMTVRTHHMGDLVLLRLVGAGAMGSVYEAAPVSLERSAGERVAVKVLQVGWDKPDVRRRFEAELRACVRLHHPGIGQVLDWGMLARNAKRGLAEHPCLVMEYIEGRTLTEVLLQAYPEGAPESLLLSCVSELLLALRAAHRDGIIHRDVKPANVMCLSNGRVKLIDFGIACFMDAETGTLVSGTPLYMSPEHFGYEPLRPGSDLYSVGVVMYQALSGRTPFDGDTGLSLMYKVTSEDAPHLQDVKAGVSPALARVVMRLLARDPDDRYQTADEVLQDLLALSPDASVEKVELRGWRPSPRGAGFSAGRPRLMARFGGDHEG